MRLLAAVLFASTLVAQSADEIMAKVADRMESATEARRQYVYRQKVRSSLTRSNGQPARREAREYSVFPTEKGTEKKIVFFHGEYRKGKQTIVYSHPEPHHTDEGLDAELLTELTDDLVNDKDSRDGIPHSLFPLASKDLAYYQFVMKGETAFEGRRVYRIAFEPVKKEMCVHIGQDDPCDSRPWKGEAWIDAVEFQPARIVTELTFQIPWGVRVFLGTNIRQTGFSITYRRVAEDVWLPLTYGTEFKLNILWGYRRTIALAMDNSNFQKTDATSTISYDVTTQ
jgi:hypothetical protein